MFSIWILKKSWLDFLTGSTEYYPSFKIKHPCLFPVVINPLASNVESSMSWRVKEWTPRHWPDVKFKKKTKRSFPWIRHFGHMVLATTFFLIDLLALDGRCGRNDAGCFNFPMTFFFLGPNLSWVNLRAQASFILFTIMLQLILCNWIQDTKWNTHSLTNKGSRSRKLWLFHFIYEETECGKEPKMISRN